MTTKTHWIESLARQIIEREADDAETKCLLTLDLARDAVADFTRLEKLERELYLFDAVRKESIERREKLEKAEAELAEARKDAERLVEALEVVSGSRIGPREFRSNSEWASYVLQMRDAQGRRK